MGILIDTGVFIRWERDGGRMDLGRWSAFGLPTISVITQSELMVGVHRADTLERRDKRLRFVQAIISSVSVLPVDSPVAETHARIIVSLRQIGLSIRAHDSWIAATAVACNCDLLTTNAIEFRRVPQLRVIDYLEAC